MQHLIINHIDHPDRSVGGQPLVVTAGIVANGQVRLLDMKPDRDTPMLGGRRWQPADGVPVNIVMDYQRAAEAVERDPARYMKAYRP
jgi:hypothetical protein